MSGICGLFNTDGAPVNRDVFNKMSRAARHRGPDGINSWVSGNVGLTQLLMATTPEARAETEPFAHTSTGSCIVFDGRIDNREDLISRLDPGGTNRRGDTDMELVLLAWLEWGVESPGHLLGDFAFAIYDGINRMLFCARDICSIKPFYYAHKEGQFTFGSTVSQVLANPAVSTEPNEGMVAEILTALHLSRAETLYRDILRLPAAHSLQIDQSGTTIRRYWHTSFTRQIRYPRFADYAAHFEELFTEAVRCRLRNRGGVAVTLSGGKDSPSVAGMAQSLLWQQGSAKSLVSYSLTYPGRSCDESALIAEVVEKWELDAHYLPFSTFERLPRLAEQSEVTRDLVEFPTFTSLAPAQAHSVAHGTRVWLSGTGSLSVLGGTEFPYLALLRDRNFKHLVTAFKNQRRQSGAMFAGAHLLASVLWPMLSNRFRKRVQSSRHGFHPGGFATEELMRRSGLEQRFAATLDAHEFDDLADWSVHQSIFSGERVFLHESYDRFNALNGIEERHPFEDRRLVEFAMAVPSFVKRDNTTSKRLLLSLGERLLPSSVLANQTKFEAGCQFLDMLCREPVRQILESAHSVEMGWVSGARLSTVYDRLYRTFESDRTAGPTAYDRKDYRELLNLWMVVALEYWLGRR